VTTSPGGNDKTVQYKNSTAFAGEAELTREAAGRFNATTSFFFTVGATGGSYPSYGFYRAAALAGDGDNTLDANYQIVAATQINSETVPIIGTYANSDGTKDLVIGGRFDWDTEETFQSITAWGDRFSLKIARFRYFKNAGASTPLCEDFTGDITTSGTGDHTVVTPQGGTFSTNKVNKIDAVVWASTSTECASWKFSCTYEGSTPVDSDHLLDPAPVKSAGASAWECELDTSGQVIFSGANGVRVTARLAYGYHV
jgi:hypothetical protein